MISPFSGSNAILKHEKRELIYRKEKYSFEALFYEDESNGEQFTTTQLDEVNLAQVYNQYRVKHSIPFVDEIISLRATYGLSASKMSAILGFGVNQYRQYEEGIMPTETNGKVLKVCCNPQTFLTYVENSQEQIGEKAYLELKKKIEQQIHKKEDILKSIIYGKSERGISNGFALLSPERLLNTMLFFIEKCGSIFCTKMNKLLFYADFCHYRNHAQAITGLSYQAIQFGPVPMKWNRVYSIFDSIEQELVEFDNGASGTNLTSNTKSDISLFTDEELKTLDTVLKRFKDTTSKEISQISHQEQAWKRFVKQTETIDFNTAFDLCTI